MVLQHILGLRQLVIPNVTSGEENSFIKLIRVICHLTWCFPVLCNKTKIFGYVFWVPCGQQLKKIITVIMVSYRERGKQ